MAKRDFYDVLGVPKGSDEAALKGAYRKLAMQFHPNRGGATGCPDCAGRP